MDRNIEHEHLDGRFAISALADWTKYTRKTNLSPWLRFSI